VTYFPSGLGEGLEPLHWIHEVQERFGASRTGVGGAVQGSAGRSNEVDDEEDAEEQDSDRNPEMAVGQNGSQH